MWSILNPGREVRLRRITMPGLPLLHSGPRPAACPQLTRGCGRREPSATSAFSFGVFAFRGRLNLSVEFLSMKMPECQSIKSLTRAKQRSCKNSQGEFQLNIQPECPPEYEPIFTHPDSLIPQSAIYNPQWSRLLNCQIAKSQNRPIVKFTPGVFSMKTSTAKDPNYRTNDKQKTCNTTTRRTAGEHEE